MKEDDDDLGKFMILACRAAAGEGYRRDRRQSTDGGNYDGEASVFQVLVLGQGKGGKEGRCKEERKHFNARNEGREKKRKNKDDMGIAGSPTARASSKKQRGEKQEKLELSAP